MKPLLSFYNTNEQHERQLPTDVSEALTAATIAASEADQLSALRHLTRATLLAAGQHTDAFRFIHRLLLILQMLPGGQEEYAALTRPAARALFSGNYQPRLSRCSFCTKDEDSVQRLIVTANVQICDECVGRCVTLLHAENVPLSGG